MVQGQPEHTYQSFKIGVLLLYLPSDSYLSITKCRYMLSSILVGFICYPRLTVLWTLYSTKIGLLLTVSMVTKADYFLCT